MSAQEKHRPDVGSAAYAGHAKGVGANPVSEFAGAVGRRGVHCVYP